MAIGSLIQNKRTAGLNSGPLTRVVNAAPLNATVTSSWFPMQGGSSIYVAWRVTRVAAVGDAQFFIDVTYDSGVTVYQGTRMSETSGLFTGNVASLLIPCTSSLNRIYVVAADTIPAMCQMRLRTTAAVVSAGSTDLITIDVAAATF